MESKNSLTLVKAINEILFALGLANYEEPRQRVGEGAVLLANLATWAEVVAGISEQDLVKAINQMQESEREQALRLMTGLKEYLPTIGLAVTKAAQIFPHQQGGRPPSFKDRDSMVQSCKLVLKLIGKGCSEAQAKRTAAKKLGVSSQTVNRIWKQRAELTTGPTFEEFLEQLLRSWSTKSSDQST
jgi:hypothetical protein